MTKRFGRTVVSRPNADRLSYAARNIGSDYAPYSGNCMSPVIVSMTGLRDKTLSRLSQWKTQHGVDYAPGHGHLGAYKDTERVQHIDVEVRCRKCLNCRKARAAHWRFRAITELKASVRTWFGTLTLAPENQFRMTNLARTRLLKGGTKWEQLSEAERLQETCREITREFQKYMKRLRKKHSGLRYLMVYEQHKSGLPHIHVLLHETATPIRHAALTAQWPLGFSKWNLVNDLHDPKAAFYITKYITKDVSIKIIASRLYGHNAT